TRWAGIDAGSDTHGGKKNSGSHMPPSVTAASGLRISELWPRRSPESALKRGDGAGLGHLQRLRPLAEELVRTSRYRAGAGAAAPPPTVCSAWRRRMRQTSKSC